MRRRRCGLTPPVFLGFNVFGSVFQLGALPIVVLAPLGGISLLFNALFARFVLRERFSFYYLGFLGIIAGAILIGFFGALPEQPRPLPELLRLLRRGPFVIFAVVLSLVVLAVTIATVISELVLYRKLADVEPRRRGKRKYSIGTMHSRDGTAHSRGPSDSPQAGLKIEISSPIMSPERIVRYEVMLGCSYGAICGTLSGFCLLFAKSAVELLILTVIGQNQFANVQSWLILFALLVIELLQLWAMNRALRHVGPTLIMPLAFCFYNVISIVAGLIYYDQLDALSSLQVGMVILGIVLLLAGVFTVSLKTDAPLTAEEEPLLGAAIVDEPEEDGENWVSRFFDRPRGLAVGLSPNSPGFALRAGSTPPGSPQFSRRRLHSSLAGDPFVNDPDDIPAPETTVAPTLASRLKSALRVA